jgi:predicted unusual protein kinase regulating ubiquinone biosynthesis (AarF/ABC1/UbiB family)
MPLKLGFQRNIAYLQGTLELWEVLKGGRSLEPLLAKLETLRGPIFKILQVLATIPELWSSPVAARLQMVTQPCPLLEAKAWQEYVITLCPEYVPYLQLEHVYVGSLGQVHPMQWHDGTLRACKIRYPQIEAVLAQDFRILELWNTAYTWWGAAIDATPLILYLKHVFQAELDYQQEGQWMQHFAAHFEGVPWVHIPRYYPEDSREGILVMSWVKGCSFADDRVQKLSQQDRTLLSQRLVQAWYHPFFTQGILHADPHIGNYSWNEGLNIYIVDFGSVCQFDPSWVEGAKQLYTALLTHKNTEDIYYDYFGFKPLSALQKTCVDQWARFLYGPFLQEGMHTLSYAMPKEGLSLLKRIHQALRTEAPLRIPGEFLVLDRTCIALGGTLVRLQGCMDWSACFQNIMAGHISI